ncbi:MAG TPA: hypothetical protein VFP43_04450, partial [Mesorhizobium sp.]|nr:hypothetical protein [Mesorhizobium sp.]
MAELSERHEVKIRGRDKTIVFTAASDDGRLIISQVREGKRAKEVCSITLADLDELRSFFRGARPNYLCSSSIANSIPAMNSCWRAGNRICGSKNDPPAQSGSGRPSSRSS